MNRAEGKVITPTLPAPHQGRTPPLELSLNSVKVAASGAPGMQALGDSIDLSLSVYISHLYLSLSEL